MPNWLVQLRLSLGQVARWTHLASRIQASALLPMLPLEGQSVALDLGCGQGHISIELARNGTRVVALDLSEEELRRLKAKAEGYTGTVEIMPVVASGTSLPFQESSIGVVVCNSVIEHIQDDERVLIEISRVVADNGVLGMTVPSRACRFAHRLPFLWQKILGLPVLYKRAFLKQYLVETETIDKARQALRERFDHKRFYTLESMRSLLAPNFVVVKYRHYMQLVGAICHDLLYAFRGLNWLLPVYVMVGFSLLDRLLPTAMQGKGVAVLATRKVRREQQD